MATGPADRLSRAVCAGSAEKETSLSIAPRVPIAVVVALPGEHFMFVMFGFVSVRCSGNDRSDILCCRCFFRNWRVPLCLHRNCMGDYRTVLTRPIYCRRDVEQAERQRHNGAERHNQTENVTQHGADSEPLASTTLAHSAGPQFDRNQQRTRCCSPVFAPAWKVTLNVA